MDYLAEIKKLPKNIQEILISSFGTKVNREIIDEFALTDEQASIFIDIVNDVYLKQVEIQNIQEEISNRLRLNPKKSLELATDTCGKKLLIADDYFKGKVSDYLQSLGINLTKYASIVAQELNAIEKEREVLGEDDNSSSFNDVLDDTNQDEEFIEQSKKDTLDLFNDDLGKILSLGPEYNDIISDYNIDLEEFLAEEDFARSLEKIILSNNDVITRIKPIVNDESKVATVENWMKDFIAFHGSGNFNAIVLAEYLVNSPSAKRLSASDKKKIKRLLNIYRNVSFFNEVVASSPANVEVIPLDHDVKDESEMKKIVDQKKTESKETSNASEKVKVIKEVEPVAEVEAEKMETEIVKPEKPSLINELEIMLQDYTPDSLEYKTILQEIKRLKSKEK